MNIRIWIDLVQHIDFQKWVESEESGMARGPFADASDFLDEESQAVKTAKIGLANAKKSDAQQKYRERVSKINSSNSFGLDRSNKLMKANQSLQKTQNAAQKTIASASKQAV